MGMKFFGVFKSRDLLCILTLAAIIRLAAIIFLPSLYHADENFQFLEQAHRLAFGYGIRPWEFSVGLRSLLLPFLFSKVFALSNYLFADWKVYILIARALLAALSLTSVIAVYQMGLRAGRTHALFVGIVAATWFEIVYFSFRPLTEAIATDFLLIALSLASNSDENFSRRRLLAIGLCLSTCLMLRIHLAPGLLIVAYWVLRRDPWRRLPYFLLGVAPPLVLFGVADYITWGSLFHSYIAAVRSNILEGKAAHFGVSPVYWYAARFIQLWAGAILVLTALVVLRWRESKLWILTALVIVAVHSLIAHKEDRFVFPAHACFVIVAALASADLIAMWRMRFGSQHVLKLTAAAIVFWCGTSVSLAVAPGFVENWTKGRGNIMSFSWLHDRPDLCGILLVGNPWPNTGGYTYLHRNVPIYDSLFDPDLLATEPGQGFNYLVESRSALGKLPPGYNLQRCYGNKDSDVCVISRPGGCAKSVRAVPLLEKQLLGE
jgi:phosphatidylinositol glycan class B